MISSIFQALFHQYERASKTNEKESMICLMPKASLKKNFRNN